MPTPASTATVSPGWSASPSLATPSLSVALRPTPFPPPRHRRCGRPARPLARGDRDSASQPPPDTSRHPPPHGAADRDARPDRRSRRASWSGTARGPADQIALTLDMGGRVGDALAIVDWLVDHEVHASIFMTGAMAENSNTDAGRRVLAIVDAHPDQFTLGNHSYTHRDFRNLSDSQIRDELRRTEAAIAPYCSQNPKPFFRPPNGGYDSDVLAAVGAAGYRQTVTWDIDTIDWRPIKNDPPGPTADQIVAKVLGNAQGGSIVLMHLGGYETFEALPRIVTGLRDAGYDLVTLDEMLGSH